MNKDKTIKDLKQYNDKIKTQLEYSKSRVWSLERENDRLTNELNTCMIERNNFLSRNKKAVEYIKQDMYVEPKELYGLVDGERLLNVLNGRSDE